MEIQTVLAQEIFLKHQYQKGTKIENTLMPQVKYLFYEHIILSETVEINERQQVQLQLATLEKHGSRIVSKPLSSPEGKRGCVLLQINGSKNMVTRCHIRVPRSPWQQIGEMIAYSGVNIRPSFAWLIPR